MNKLIYQANLKKTVDLLSKWLEERIPEEKFTYVKEKQQLIQNEGYGKNFITAFAKAPKLTGKQLLDLPEKEIVIAQLIRSGWSPNNWSLDQTARTLYMLSIPHKDQESYIQTVNTIFNNADIMEAIALYQSIALLPYPKILKNRAEDGVRNNIIPIFNAIALNNPYPSDHFDQNSWNQLILKAVFIESPLNQIIGLDQRNNKELTILLKDYTAERLAANRLIHPDVSKLIESEIRES